MSGIAKASPESGVRTRLPQREQGKKDLLRPGHSQHRSNANPGSKAGDKD